MSVNSKRDVTLGVGIETTGTEGLQRMAAEVRRLAAEGGPAAERFGELATQIDRLAKESAQIDGLRALAEDVAVLESAQEQAAAATAAAREALERQATVASTARQEQARLAQEVVASRAALRTASDAVRDLRETTDAAGKSTAGYAASIAAARAEVRAKALDLDVARAAQAAYGATVAAAVNDESKLAAAAERASSAQDKAAATLRARQGALESARAALEAATGSTADLADAEARLLARQNDLVAATRAEAQAVGESTDAMERLDAAARAADQQQAALVASLREARAAAESYARAMSTVVAGSENDAQAMRSRVAAARQLIEADDRLTQEQRELATSMDSARGSLLAEAAAMIKAAEAADASRAATARLVAEASRASAALDSAFGDTGIRGLAAIEREARQTELSLEFLERQFRQGAVSAVDLERATGAAAVKLRRLRDEAAQIQSVPGAFERVNTTVTGVINRFGALTAAIGTVAVAARPAIESLMQLEQVRRILTTVTGSAESAAQQIDFLRKVSSQAGVSFDSVAGSYAKFAASALQANLSIEQVQQTFKSVALAAGNLGLSSDQAQRALEALSQMASKGTVGMEELRQQLGDALPGVLPLLAQQLGLTNRELAKLVESGGLAATEALPAVAKAMERLGPASGQVDGMAASWNRFKSGLSETVALLDDGPVGVALSGLATLASKVGGALATAAVTVSELVSGATRGLGALAGTLSGGQGLGAAVEAFREQVARADQRVLDLAQRFGLLRDSGQSTAASVGAVGSAAAAAGESMAKMSLRHVELQEAAKATAAVTAQYAAALKESVRAAEEHVKSSLDAKGATQELLGAQERYVKAVEDSIRAGEVEVRVVRASKDELLARLKAEGQSTEGYKAQIVEIDKKIAALGAETAKTVETAKAEREKAESLRQSLKALEDNSGEYTTLKKTVEEAESTLRTVAYQMARGRATSEDYASATKDLRKAKADLVDASKDVVSGIEREIKAHKSANDVIEAGLKLEIARLKNRIAEAAARGDETTARRLSIQLSETELRLTSQGTDAKFAEIKMRLQALAQEEDELRARGALTPILEAEIRARRNALVAETLETQTKVEANKERVREHESLVKNGGARKESAGNIQAHTSAMGINTAGTIENTKAQGAGTSAVLTHAAAFKTLAETLAEYGEKALLASAAQRALAEAANAARGATSLGNQSGATLLTPVRSPTNSDNRLSADGGTNFSTLGAGGGATSFSVAGQYTPPDNSGDWEFDVEEFYRNGGGAGNFTDDQAKRFWRRKGGNRIGPGLKSSARPPVAATAGPTTSGAPPRSMVVELKFGSTTATVPTTEEGADGLLKVLETARLASGG